ncbi:alkali-sensitive linkage protein 1 [Aspergillus udagawae]|uniref:Alkali-sensitive linkage protein 1 n=1 Tax=Aspergillus udagawae TaxID=91492 RepID=A0A8H3RGA0_9EURO|nr:alkali-sensitive linkage protein 1 [Aspergillus udagawae]GFF38667.1 alkali-sensitive linkage protein 1 [Aspergillus udagawae]GFF71918.1 alkali-sensitive linkage protein 1 [Aspergillus udagawae]GFG16862.1 alkali-sensitive linkage protein 1 [Aspergillus udagawae]GFG21597.1 alkali-sensitive linkage protein 1 [Aspergillus udagawae]
MVSLKNLLTAGLLASSAVAAPHGHQHSHIEKRSSTKRGAAYNDASTVQALGNTGSISWAYDWNMLASGTLPSGVEFVPMLWGSKMFGGWLAAIETALASGSNYILGFNEPDSSAQSAMSPSEAAQAYKQYITPYSGKAKLVSPGVTNSPSAGEGLDWMNSFLQSCTDCGISTLAVHWYGSSADEFKTFVNQATSFASEKGLESVWITEFALSSDLSTGASSSESAQFLSEVLPWLDSQPMVGRYAYFMCADNYLLSGSGLTSTGQIYAS